MGKERLEQEPAYPSKHYNVNGHMDKQHEGISKRFYAACAAMQGILASGKFVLPNEGDFSYCAELSYMFADELLKQEKL